MRSEDSYQLFDKPFDQMINTNTITELHQLQTKLSEQSKPKEVAKAQLDVEESSKTKDETTSAEVQPAPSQTYQLSQVDQMSQMSAQNQADFDEIKDSLAQVENGGEKDLKKRNKAFEVRITKMHIMI